MRERLNGLVARFGVRLASDPEAWRACELELTPLYAGPQAVRAYAIVQALKGGLVADLVTWHAEGVRGMEPELAQRLTERSGVAAPLAQWAVGAWSAAFDIPAVSEPPAPVPAPAVSRASRASPSRRPTMPRPASRAVAADEPRFGGRVLTVRVPHLVAAGALAAFAVVLLIGSGAAPLPDAIDPFGQQSAALPAPPPAPALDEASRLRRSTSSVDREEIERLRRERRADSVRREEEGETPPR